MTKTRKMILKKVNYLKENRLSDVVALIQVLAIGHHTHRSVNGLKDELQGIPKSAENWGIIAEEHPEFFRFNKEKHIREGAEAHTVSLLARHVIKKNSEGTREFPPEFTRKLLETALELHDKQKDRSDSWKVYLPIIVAVVTVLSSFFVQFTNNQNQAFLKHYEVEFKPKQEGYSKFMKEISTAYFASQRHDFELMTQSLDNAENSFYAVEPFLDVESRDSFWNEYQKFSSFCYSEINKKNEVEKSSNIFYKYKTFFRKKLFKVLFASEDRSIR